MIGFVEDEITEFKKTTGELKEAIISIVAMLNKHQNGRLYFGIKDDGTVIGQTVTGKTLRDVSDAIGTKIEPRIYPNINKIVINEKDCILVEFSGDDLPYLADGRAYIRVSDQDRQLSVSELRNIMLKKVNESEKWDSLLSNKTIADVNEETLKKYIDRANKAKRIPFEYTTKEDVLNKLGLIKDNYLLNAGKVLFCDDSGVELQMAIFATNTKTTFIDIDKKTGNIFDLIKEAQEYIMKNIIWNVKITDTREEIPEIPIESIREAIVNCFAHKLYIDPKGVEISIFKDRVEIYNPGPFPEEYTPEDYINNKAHSILRNPLIANILYKSKDVETYSSGIQRMYNECMESDVEIGFRKESLGFVVVFKRCLTENDGINVENDGINVENDGIKTESDGINSKSGHESGHQGGHESGHQGGHESGYQITTDSYKEKILEYCKQPKTAKEIREYLDIKSRQYVSAYLINPLIKENKLDYIDKNNIKSKNQKYITVKQTLIDKK